MTGIWPRSTVAVAATVGAQALAEVIRHLPFLIDRDEALYHKLIHIYFRDDKARLTI